MAGALAPGYRCSLKTEKTRFLVMFLLMARVERGGPPPPVIYPSFIHHFALSDFALGGNRAWLQSSRKNDRTTVEEGGFSLKASSLGGSTARINSCPVTCSG